MIPMNPTILLPQERWRAQPSFTIVELGFGLGANFLATLGDWHNHPRRPKRLHYVAVEANPVDGARLAREARALGGTDAEALAARWPIATPGLHRLAFADGAVTLTLAFGDAGRMLPKLSVAADAFHLGDFAPDTAPPTRRDPALIRALARLARPEATLTSDAADTALREHLAAAGFEVTQAWGVAPGRARFAARYSPRWRTFAPPAAATTWPERSAVIVGAGLAGCATAAALAARGWRVTLLERRARPASEGSAQPALADHLHVSPDDNPLARLSRAALLMRRNVAATGKLQVAESDAEFERLRAMVDTLGFPERFVQSLNAGAASDVAGVRLARGGLWLPMCGASNPADWCARTLGAGGDAIEIRTGVEVARIDRAEGFWRALGADGRAIARAPAVVLANAGDAVRLGGLASARLRRIRGQTTVLGAHLLPGLRTVLGGDAYACPLPDGRVLVGSTFDDGDTLDPDPQADLDNLRRLRRMLADGALPGQVDGTACASAALGFRFAARDRMPLIGALPDETAAGARVAELARNDRLPLPMREGLYGAFAFGARGQLWSGLAGEILGAELEGEPAPIELDLLAAVAPGRFLRQALRTRRLR